MASNDMKIAPFLKSDPNLIPINSHEMYFYDQIKSYMNIVKNYEDLRLQEKVRQLIPWKEMTIKAINKMIAIKQNVESDDNQIDSKDILLLDLLNWFKTQFFAWFETPVCETCGVKLLSVGNCSPTSEELRWSASRVELYKCNVCGFECRFARYNNCEKLLATRVGRCGEWANCFTLVCRAFNYDARLVLDWTDHVWTEVYSNAQKRWLHCDACENACDTPLVYEVGWAKKLTYCVAISYYEVQDVSWRYSNDHSSLVERRTSLCREQWIASILNKITDNLQLTFTSDMKRELKIRRLMEFVEFIRVPNQVVSVKEGETNERLSGALAWRIARNEVSCDSQLSTNYKFEFTSNRTNPSLITYNCCSDEYNFNGIIIKQWKTCTYKSENLFREVERDWKMVYLSRNKLSHSSNQIGLISWNLHFNSDIKWKEMRIKIVCKTFESGSIKLNLHSLSRVRESNAVLLTPNIENVIERSSFGEEDNELVIEASLEGGNGSIAWQHSQLFRQSIENEFHLNTLVVEIRF